MSGFQALRGREFDRRRIDALNALDRTIADSLDSGGPSATTVVDTALEAFAGKNQLAVVLAGENAIHPGHGAGWQKDTAPPRDEDRPRGLPPRHDAPSQMGRLFQVHILDLAKPPDPSEELRMRLNDCYVSLWLPADTLDMSEALGALARAGFDIVRTEPSEDESSG